RVQLQVECDHPLAFRGRRWRLARTAYIQYRDLGGEAVRNPDEGAVEIDGAGEVEALAQFALQPEVGVEVGGEDVAGDGLRVLGRQPQVERQPRLLHADGAGHRQLSRCGARAEAGDVEQALTAGQVS